MKFIPLRDSKGNLVAKAIEKTNKKETVRSIIGRMTNNGEALLLNMLKLANFTPIVVKNADGTELAEPLVATPAVALEANKWLLEQFAGKAVAQNEVDRSAAESAIIDQLRALSDDELEQRVKEFVAPKPVVEMTLEPGEAGLPSTEELEAHLEEG